MYHNCIIGQNEEISHMYEVPIQSIKWSKISFDHRDTTVNAMMEGSHLHFKNTAELLAKQQRLESFLKLTIDRAKKARRFLLRKKKTQRRK